MAAARPAAVAISASEIPGATMAKVADPLAPIPLKVSMMPQTVPKRPIKGLALPVVARKPRVLSNFVLSESRALFRARSILSILFISTEIPSPLSAALPVRDSRITFVTLISSV